MRAIYRFGKTGRLICISHLDLQRFMQMALRRTELPIAYSQGFNPHPILSFASALAMSWTSEAELMDIKFASDVTRDFAFDQMKGALPPDLPLLDARLVDDRHPALMAMLRMADYRITLGDGGERVAGALPDYLAQREVMAIRKTKSGEKPVDIRPLTKILTAEQAGGGWLLNARLSLTEADTLKPDLLVRVLAARAGIGGDVDMRIHRVGLLAEDEKGRAVDLFER